MSFDNSRFLLLLFLLVVLVPVVIVRYRRGKGKAALFAAASPSHEREFFLKELQRRIIIADVFFIFFFVFLVIALAGPRWGVRIVPDYRRGVDVVLAFDLSRSMNVRDCSLSVNRSASRSASRLERGIAVAEELVAALKDVRLGTVIGKGRGVLAVPLTYDSESVLTFLYSLDSLAVSGRGTNLESLVNAASASFQDSIPSRRGIILFSDGEAHSGSFQAAAEKLRKAGITLSAVGLGSDEGGPVPAERGPDAPNGFLIAQDGEPVTSARQGETLRGAAEKSGGVYVSGDRSDAAQMLAGYINSLSAESRLSGHRREANPRWRIFVLAAMTCLAGMRVMGFTRQRRQGREQTFKERTKGKALFKGRVMEASLLLLVFFLSSCTKTQGKLLIMEGNFFNARGFYTEAISSYLMALDYDEAVPYAEYGLASAYFALEEDSAALDRYRAAAQGVSEFAGGDPELRFRINYNTGIIHFGMGEYNEAARAFRNALEVDGSRIEAKRNLELSLLIIDRTSSPQAASAPGSTESGGEGRGGSNPAIFEYLRQKEQEQWKSKEWESESDTSGPDY